MLAATPDLGPGRLHNLGLGIELRVDNALLGHFPPADEASTDQRHTDPINERDIMTKPHTPWARAARVGAAIVLGFGVCVPAVTACSGSSGDETEQSQDSSESDGDLEETDPEPDIEE